KPLILLIILFLTGQGSRRLQTHPQGERRRPSRRARLESSVPVGPGARRGPKCPTTGGSHPATGARTVARHHTEVGAFIRARNSAPPTKAKGGRWPPPLSPSRRRSLKAVVDLPPELVERATRVVQQLEAGELL